MSSTFAARGQNTSCGYRLAPVQASSVSDYYRSATPWSWRRFSTHDHPIDMANRKPSDPISAKTISFSPPYGRPAGAGAASLGRSPSG
jgi:hypothetical protein